MDHGEPVLTAVRIERPEPDVASLVARAGDGDLAAFETVYRMHAGRVFAVCMRLAGDRGDAEELAQDAWVRAWERIAQFRGDASFGTWMHRLTVNLMLDRKRQDARWRGRVASLDDDSGEALKKVAVSEAPAVRMDIERAVAALPQGARVVFVLHEIEGFKYAEIAERLDIAVGTVKAQLHRARKLLPKALER